MEGIWDAGSSADFRKRNLMLTGKTHRQACLCVAEQVDSGTLYKGFFLFFFLFPETVLQWLEKPGHWAFNFYCYHVQTSSRPTLRCSDGLNTTLVEVILLAWFGKVIYGGCICLLEWHSLDDPSMLHLMIAFAWRISHVLLLGLDADVVKL